MAGVTTPALAAAVSNAGALGALGVGTISVDAARAQIRELRALSDQPFNVNFFCHAAPRRDAAREASWLHGLRPLFESLGAQPPEQLALPFGSFLQDPGMLAMLLEERPPVVSFHFGLPAREAIAALKGAGIKLLATATQLDEALMLARAGIDAVIAQGYEAGGHRGIFDPEGKDARLGTLVLTRLLVKHCPLPVIAAGGIMDGAGIAACQALGASAAQLGTAFIGCPESSADASYRAALRGSSQTVMTTIFSGRPARGLANRLTALELDEAAVPAYPAAYTAARALAVAARAAGEAGYAVQWAGQGAPLARELPAAELVAVLEEERKQAR